MSEITSPDSLLNDPDSKEFFVLRDERLVVVRHRNELPSVPGRGGYLENRSTYLSAGRFSPMSKQVAFWPSPVNPGRALELLREGLFIKEDFTTVITGAEANPSVVKKAGSKNRKSALDKLTGVRKRQVEVLMDHGKMSIQTDEPESNNG